MNNLNLTKEEAAAVYNMVLAARVSYKEISEDRLYVLEALRLKMLHVMHRVDEECIKKDIINNKLF